VPAEIRVRRGAGVNGSDRVTFTWPDGQIRNTWLRVTVFANDHTALAAPDVFYFGNAVGETGNRAGDTRVNAADARRARRNRTPRWRPCPGAPPPPPPVPVTSPFDFDRNALVDALDARIARQYRTRRRDALHLISV
jgi:hypothetical protein